MKKSYLLGSDLLAILIVGFIFSLLYPSVGYIENKYNLLIFLWRLSPIISIYLILRVFKLNFLASSLITILVLCGLDTINTKKTALTSSPISFSDLIEIKNLSVAIHYLNFKETITIVIGLLLFIFLLYFFHLIHKKYIKKQGKSYTYLLSILFIAFITPTLFPRIESVFKDNNLIQKIAQRETDMGIAYISWDWWRNVQNNGVPYHLIQTSMRKMIPKSDHNGDMIFNSLIKNQQLPTIDAPSNIVFILCEACWYNDNYFRSSFTPLINMGFKEARMIAPVYGGGTANSEFEVLTGLPSNSSLVSGILYQEYAVSFSNKSLTLPKHLYDVGYNTYAAHNNTKYFYNRDIVLNKFGIIKYDGIEDMQLAPNDLIASREPWQWQNDDWPLYHQAINYLKDHEYDKNFLHLLNMSTHGPHIKLNDHGEKSYIHQINEAIDRLTYFIKEVEKIDSNSLIIIYGDHMPSLASFFYEKGIFTDNEFIQTGTENGDFIFNKEGDFLKIVGDVPILIKGNNKYIDKLISKINNKPLFCLPIALDDEILKINMPITQYAIDWCNNLEENFNYNNLIDRYESWMYYNLLFKQ